MPTPWLWDLGESLSLSELQLLGCKTTLSLLCGLRGETRSPACQPALPRGFIRGAQQGWHTERHDKPSGPIRHLPPRARNQDKDTSKGERPFGNKSGQIQALPGGGFPHRSQGLTWQPRAFFWHDLSCPMDHVSDSLESISGPGFVQRLLTFSACRGQPQSPEQGPL